MKAMTPAGGARDAPDAAERVSSERSAFAAASRALHDNAPYVLLVAVYVAVGAVVLGELGHGIPYEFTEIYEQPTLLTLLYLGVTFLVAVGRDVIAAGKKPFARATWRGVYFEWLGTRRLVGALIILATLPALLDVMLGLRQALTDIKPFSYDAMFVEWDRWLHVGRHPWELLQPVLGHPAITIIVDRSYVYGWFLLLWTTTIWQAVHGREPIRLQYFLSFTICWVLLGSMAAIALSSAGPVYYGRVTGLEDPYAPLMVYLESVNAHTPLHALSNQERLWLTYRTWGGITAMPSMHLAITTVASLTAIRSDRRLAYIVLPLWLVMLLGSVHLGWHYAVDSYLGIAAATVIWYACGPLARRWIDRRPERVGVTNGG